MSDKDIALNTVRMMEDCYNDTIIPLLNGQNYAMAQGLMEKVIFSVTRGSHETIERNVHSGIELLSRIDMLYQDTKAAAINGDPVKELIMRNLVMYFRQTRLPKNR